MVRGGEKITLDATSVLKLLRSEHATKKGSDILICISLEDLYIDY